MLPHLLTVLKDHDHSICQITMKVIIDNLLKMHLK